MSFTLFPDQNVPRGPTETANVPVSLTIDDCPAHSDSDDDAEVDTDHFVKTTVTAKNATSPLFALERSTSPRSQPPILSQLKAFLHKNCRDAALQIVANDGSITAASIFDLLLPTNDEALSIHSIAYWQRLTMDLLNVIASEAFSPQTRTTPSSFAQKAPSLPAPQPNVPPPRGAGGSLTARPRVIFPPSKGLTHWSPAFFGTPTAMLSKANVGDEEDDGSYTINQHVVLMPLGHGAQGEVVLAMDTKKNELRAIKSIPRPKGIYNSESPKAIARGALGAAKAARRQQLEREIAIMKHCRHRNIVALHEVIDDPDLDVMYLVMQYVEKGPIARLQNGATVTPIDPVKLAGYTVQLCAGLSYLHRKGVIHRDIKPDNILIGAHDDVYLADFGTSDLFRGDESHRVLGHRGTTSFMAPELLDTKGADTSSDEVSNNVRGEAVDIWALGITLYVLLYGKLPWHSTRLASLVDEIIECRSVVAVPTPYAPSAPATSAQLLQPPPQLYRKSGSFRDGTDQEVSSSAGSINSEKGSPVSPRGSPLSALASRGVSPRACAVPDIHTQWAELLNDILRRDPSQRLSLDRISMRAQAIFHQHKRQDSIFSQTETDLGNSVAITSRNH